MDHVKKGRKEIEQRESVSYFSTLQDIGSKAFHQRCSDLSREQDVENGDFNRRRSDPLSTTKDETLFDQRCSGLSKEQDVENRDFNRRRSGLFSTTKDETLFDQRCSDLSKEQDVENRDFEGRQGFVTGKFERLFDQTCSGHLSPTGQDVGGLGFDHGRNRHLSREQDAERRGLDQNRSSSPLRGSDVGGPGSCRGIEPNEGLIERQSALYTCSISASPVLDHEQSSVTQSMSNIRPTADEAIQERQVISSTGDEATRESEGIRPTADETIQEYDGVSSSPEGVIEANLLQPVQKTVHDQSILEPLDQIEVDNLTQRRAEGLLDSLQALLDECNTISEGQLFVTSKPKSLEEMEYQKTFSSCHRSDPKSLEEMEYQKIVSSCQGPDPDSSEPRFKNLEGPGCGFSPELDENSFDPRNILDGKSIPVDENKLRSPSPRLDSVPRDSLEPQNILDRTRFYVDERQNDPPRLDLASKGAFGSRNFRLDCRSLYVGQNGHQDDSP
jgi:hypothetical protein